MDDSDTAAAEGTAPDGIEKHAVGARVLDEARQRLARIRRGPADREAVPTVLLPVLPPEAGGAATVTTKPRTEDLSPECQLGECGLCPGANVPAYAPGQRPLGEPPVFVYHCAHGCGHGRRSSPRARS